jgi:CDP-diacylglycerol--glycerol-3-phosphate 3-phosphatidyltransferase
MKNLANILTITRLALLPFMIVLFYLPFNWAAWLCLVLFTIGALTDFFDGWVARKFNQISEFGKLMDPIADKVFVITILLMLVASGRIDGFYVLCVVVILMREFVVSGIREYLAPKNIKLPVTNMAKWKTTVQMLATGLLILAPVNVYADAGGKIFLVLAAAMTVVTGAQYLTSAFKHLRADHDAGAGL